MKLTKLSEKYRKSTVNQMYIESRAFEAGYRAGEASKESEIQNLIDRVKLCRAEDESLLTRDTLGHIIKALKSLL